MRLVFLALLVMSGCLMPHVASAQQQVPITLSPLRIESDPNGVNLATGKTTLGLPMLAVPGAPNLRFDRIQNFAPYATATVSGGRTEMIQVAVSVHTGTGNAESFNCPDWDSAPSQSGSLFDVWTFMKGGSGEIYYFNSKHVETTGVTKTMTYYATAVHYPDGEVITYTTIRSSPIPAPTIVRVGYRAVGGSSSLFRTFPTIGQAGCIGARRLPLRSSTLRRPGRLWRP
jgi:hypothetical protein